MSVCMKKKEIQAQKERQLVLAYIQGKYDALLEFELMSRNKSITMDVLNKIREEMEKIPAGPFMTAYTAKHEALKIIDKHMEEMKVENHDN